MECEELPTNLQKIIEKGEGVTVEFKEAKKKLPVSLLKYRQPQSHWL